MVGLPWLCHVSGWYISPESCRLLPEHLISLLLVSLAAKWSLSLRDGEDVAHLFNFPEGTRPAGIPLLANAISLPSEVYRSPLSQVILVSGPYAAGLQALVQTGSQKLELAAKFLHLTQLRPRPCRNHSSQGEKQLDICGGGRAGTLFFKHVKC